MNLNSMGAGSETNDLDVVLDPEGRTHMGDTGGEKKGSSQVLECMSFE